MNRIGWGQLGIVLALSRIFAEAANFPSDDINYGMQRFTVIILSYILLGIALVPVYILTTRGGTVKIISKPAAIIMIIYLIMAGISTATRLQFYTSSTIFDAAPPWLIILFVSAVCLYGLFKGLPAVARSGIIISVFFLLLLGAVIIGTADDFRLNRLYPAFSDNPSSLLGDAVTEFSKNGELVIFAALCGNVREKQLRSIVVYPVVALSAQLLMTFLYNTVLGEYLNVTSFPFYMLSALSDISLLQRLDGIDVVVWVMSAVIKLSLLVLAVEAVCVQAFANRTTARITAALSLAVTAAASIGFSVNTNDFLVFAGILETALPLLAAGVIAPLWAIAAARMKKRKEKTVETA